MHHALASGIQSAKGLPQFTGLLAMNIVGIMANLISTNKPHRRWLSRTLKSASQEEAFESKLLSLPNS